MSAIRSSRILLTRGTGYGFGAHQPKNNWNKWRESQIIAAMPPNDSVKPVPFPLKWTFAVCFVVGSAIPVAWAIGKSK